jgi:hypothetical protein
LKTVKAFLWAETPNYVLDGAVVADPSVEHGKQARHVNAGPKLNRGYLSGTLMT